METFSFKKLFDDTVIDNKVTGNQFYPKKADVVEKILEPNNDTDHVTKIVFYSTFLHDFFLHSKSYSQEFFIFRV